MELSTNGSCDQEGSYCGNSGTALALPGHSETTRARVYAPPPVDWELHMACASYRRGVWWILPQIYGLMIANKKVVTLVEPKRTPLHPTDLLL
jgi:hypothetical protein